MKTKLLVILLIAVMLFPQATTAQAQSSDPRQMGSQIIARAKIWVDKSVPYNNQTYPDGYRADCSGFASYAWQVKDSKGKIDNPDGIRLASDYGVKIAFDSLQPGDIMTNRLRGDDGHVVIFVKWIKKGSTFVAYEENGNPDGNDSTNDGRALETKLTLTYKSDGSVTIKQYDGFAPGPYDAYRYKNISGFVDVLDGVFLSNYAPKSGESVTGWFQIRNNGGQAITISQLALGARGPNAKSQGWNAPNVDFPAVKNIYLKPGETYKYLQSRSFFAYGDYFVEAVKDQNGWGGIYPYPRSSFDVK